MKEADIDRAISERVDLIVQTQEELDVLKQAREVMFGKKEDGRETSKHKPKDEHPWKKDKKKRGPYRKCETEGCDGKHLAKGLCKKCYWQSKNKGETPPTKTKEETEEDVYPPGLKVKISSCCGETAFEGASHGEGNMYCEECKEPCEWIWKPPPSDR